MTVDAILIPTVEAWNEYFFHLEVAFPFALIRFTRKKCKRKRKEMKIFPFLASALSCACVCVVVVHTSICLCLRLRLRLRRSCEPAFNR